jgi:hypothetical protein
MRSIHGDSSEPWRVTFCEPEEANNPFWNSFVAFEPEGTMQERSLWGILLLP